MTKRFTGPSVIDYKSLGTINIAEFRQALWEDIQALADSFNVQYITAAKLIVPCTNEYGDPLIIKFPDGRVLRHCDTHYYRPACLDYKL